METLNYSMKISVDGATARAFDCINNVSAWWTKDLEGNTSQLGDEFKVTFGSTWKKFKITEFIPNVRVTWQVTDCYMPWNVNQTEWKGTKISFDIVDNAGQTVVTFTHFGLMPMHCADECTNAWGEYLQGNLKDLVMVQATDGLS